MSNNDRSHHLQGRPNSNSVQNDHRPYWKRAHRDWRVWTAVLLMIIGMIIYVLSQDLSLRPRSRPHQPLSGIFGKERNTLAFHDQGDITYKDVGIINTALELIGSSMQSKNSLLNLGVVAPVRDSYRGNKVRGALAAVLLCDARGGEYNTARERT